MDFDDEFDQQYGVFCDLLEVTTPPGAVKKLKLLSVADDVIQRIVDRHENETIKIQKMEEPSSVYVGDRMTWYTGPRSTDENWPALVRCLERKNFGDENLDSLDQASTKVVSLLPHPREEAFRSLGLVVGFVQSGKTTNFTAVMAKAADRGYKMFIVLSGIHNALRRQTQLRLEKDLIEAHPQLWHQITTPEHDFKPSVPASSLVASKGQHLLLVVKKNARVLEKLRDWLAGARDQLAMCPTMIIDDEADQSTVATNKINPLLHDVLQRFPKVAYIGYTATPFANLLINPADESDFYPRDFIVNLPHPKRYYGTEVLFGRELADWEDPEDAEGGHDMIRRVPDEDVSELKPASKKEAACFEPSLTSSLIDAVTWFWLATAARKVRGTGNPHSTMLIHTSVDTSVHNSFRAPLMGLRASTLRRLDAEDPGTISRLSTTWARETARVPADEFDEEHVPFSDVLSHLRSVVRDTRIVIDNYRSEDRLDYDSGPVTAIAIGGNTLSRGLTLEGLVSSLFVRAVSAYDTLLQMGRWFGYRDGYADLPRIWMTDELTDWFRHLATVEAEMRRDIDRYMVENVNPRTFAVRLRSHPKLLITTKAKMQDAVLASAAYGGELVETRYFDVGPGAEGLLRDNETAAKTLLAESRAHGVQEMCTKERVLYTAVPHDAVIRFLNTYSWHEKSADGRRNRLTGYIRKRVAAGSLRRWSVAVIGSERGSDKSWEFGNDECGVTMVRRARLGQQDEPTSDPADIKTLTSRRDETIDLQIDGSRNLSRQDILAHRTRQRSDEGLVLLYPIDPVSDTKKPGRSRLDAPAEVVIGVALVFPRPSGEDTVVEEYEYYSADLSALEQEDVAALDYDEEVA
jgi:hypothetical protein